MLANRLKRIAEDIQREFEEFDVMGLLKAGISLSANRPNLNSTQYAQQRNALVQRANEIIAKTVFRIYPLDLLTVISNSDLSSVLPGNLAKLIVSGFPTEKEAAISSAELQMYSNSAHNVLSQISGQIAFSSRLGIQTYDIAEGKIGLDIKLPRHVFENYLGLLSEKINNFNQFMRSATELATGSREEIQLVYLSTTDPIIASALIPAAAWSILQFYKLFLEVAEKQINVWKAIRDLKNSGLAQEETASISEKMQTVIRSEVDKAIELAFSRIDPKVGGPRANEIKIEIGKQAVEIIGDIAQGARIYISLESQNKVDVIAESAPNEGVTPQEFRGQIEEQKTIEARLDGIVGESRLELIGATINQAPRSSINSPSSR